MNEKIKKICDSILGSKNSFGISIRVERGNEELVFNLDAGNLEENNSYFIASTTKLFTTAMIYKLIAENKLHLDDTLRKFFSEDIINGLNFFNGKDYSDSITIKQLLSHTSGIPDYFSGKDGKNKSLEEGLMNGLDESWGVEKSVVLAKSIKSKFYPGQKGKALYSDTNFQLLGRILEFIRKKGLKEIFQEEIFLPLSLKSTYLFENLPNQKPTQLYYKEKELIIPLAMSSFGPDGGIVSTSEDMMVFLKAFFRGGLFPKKYVYIMGSEYNRIFFPLQNGVGIMKFQLPRFLTLGKVFPPLIGHSGLSGAFAFYCPEKDIYLTGTTNQLASKSRSFELMIKILQII